MVTMEIMTDVQVNALGTTCRRHTQISIYDGTLRDGTLVTMETLLNL